MQIVEHQPQLFLHTDHIFSRHIIFQSLLSQNIWQLIKLELRSISTLANLPLPNLAKKMYWEKIEFITLDFRHLHFGVNLFMKKLPQSRRVILPCNIDTRTTSTVGLWCNEIPEKWFLMIDKLFYNYRIKAVFVV